jgi:flagellar M-ring protein FliF
MTNANSSFVIREFVIHQFATMDFLNKAIAQLSELFRSMTPGARITAGLLLAVVVVSIGYLFQHSSTGPDAYLFGGEPISSGQLDRIEAAIAKAGLSDFQREGFRIRVPSGQQAKYLAAVADAGALPPNFNTILENALDKGGPWESREATRERLKIARQQTLSEIVRAMPWVENAIVLYDEHESRGVKSFGTTIQTTASVSVKPVAGEMLTPQRAKNIQRLVAHSVNMKATDVGITNLGDGGPAGTDGGITYDVIDDEYLKTKVMFESQKRDSILGALREIPGVSVEVNADFDDTVEETTHTAKPDPKTAARTETSQTEDITSSTPEGGGQVGVTANGPNRQVATQSVPQAQNRTHNESTRTDNVVGIEDSRVLKKGYTPKEVWATVSIPGSYIKNLWTAKNPTATAPPKPEDLATVQTDAVQKVENIVDTLLLLQANKGENTYKHVHVVVLDSLPVPTLEAPTMASKAMAWTSRYWNSLAMLGVAMFSLLVLRSVVNGKPGEPSSGAISSAPSLTLQADEPNGASESSDAPDAGKPKLRLKKGTSVKDDLVDIVKEDPDAAADILRSWIAKAG